ncbi:acyl carrier protein [Amycolatopsis regifaucium]|uniref:Actinorhodin polyketide synthase n=1 Tax=Amycolatopsis regifaucium TaxID=546365 RepID=A0A154MVL8_9PSEU|nr:acyl carrier protein [Amycolatopsis regifaucium]KZB88321.1 actinorhodin polyketide synthase [Amycolatopsis regifaucium]OKA11433.1 actinorhodin polyketide synthase [Amycolatopsis regifaucium]SFH41935.1 act minimal PKS acyl carrier protein [Amycolatopsis regifaucium]
MNQLTIEDLREILRSSVGVDEGVDLDADIDDVEFAELGYDSLAILELAGQLQRRYGVTISDDVALDMRTPAEALRTINRQLERTAR